VLSRIRSCIISEVTQKYGQATVETRGAPITLNARTTGEEVLHRGDRALVIGHNKERDFFQITQFKDVKKAEYINISVHRIEIDRRGTAGLICRDNVRADITVAFFVRINKTENDVLKVAQSIGCKRASDRESIILLFDAKFSEALKTGGRRFDFVELYNSREEFRDEIIKVVGTDLNGFVLEDVAIDFLEQTSLEHLNPNNILDAEGIKKVTDLTATQAKLANQIVREKEKVITQQIVETHEKILELNRQLAEVTEKQKREVATKKTLAETVTAETSAPGLGQARVQEAKA
jgi:uncharacterized membrane protein YqiK